LQQGSALTIGLYVLIIFNIFNAAVLEVLNAKLFEALLQLAPKNGVASGRTYDTPNRHMCRARQGFDGSTLRSSAMSSLS
jgi:hypothetical protein